MPENTAEQLPQLDNVRDNATQLDVLRHLVRLAADQQLHPDKKPCLLSTATVCARV